MRRSERIENKFSQEYDSSRHYARLASTEFFTRLVEDLTDSEVVSYHYFEDVAEVNFTLKGFSQMLTISLWGCNLADCTKNIILETQDFLSENKRKDL